MTGYPSTRGRGQKAPQRPLEISNIHIKSLVCPTDMKFGTHVEQAETNTTACLNFPNGSTAPPRNFQKIHIKSLVSPTSMTFGTHVEQAETICSPPRGGAGGCEGPFDAACSFN